MTWETYVESIGALTSLAERTASARQRADLECRAAQTGLDETAARRRREVAEVLSTLSRCGDRLRERQMPSGEPSPPPSPDTWAELARRVAQLYIQVDESSGQLTSLRRSLGRLEAATPVSAPALPVSVEPPRQPVGRVVILAGSAVLAVVIIVILIHFTSF